MKAYMPRMALLVGVFGMGIFSIGCGSGDSGDVLCTTSVDPGITLTVFDAQTGLPAAEGATATLTDGAFAETMQPFTFNGDPALTRFQGAYERVGTYTVRVTKPGYTAFERSGVVVTRNICHVNTLSLRADLVPIP